MYQAFLVNCLITKVFLSTRPFCPQTMNHHLKCTTCLPHLSNGPLPTSNTPLPTKWHATHPKRHTAHQTACHPPQMTYCPLNGPPLASNAPPPASNGPPPTPNDVTAYQTAHCLHTAHCVIGMYQAFSLLMVFIYQHAHFSLK